MSKSRRPRLDEVEEDTPRREEKRRREKKINPKNLDEFLDDDDEISYDIG